MHVVGEATSPWNGITRKDSHFSAGSIDAVVVRSPAGLGTVSCQTIEPRDTWFSHVVGTGTGVLNTRRGRKGLREIHCRSLFDMHHKHRNIDRVRHTLAESRRREILAGSAMLSFAVTWSPSHRDNLSRRRPGCWPSGKAPCREWIGTVCA